MIKVINGFYDADKRRIIEKDELLDVDEKKAKKLIALGLAVEIKEPEKPKKVSKKQEECMADFDILTAVKSALGLQGNNYFDDTLKFYIEEVKQTSIRTAINLPTSVQVSGNLGLKRV